VKLSVITVEKPRGQCDGSPVGKRISAKPSMAGTPGARNSAKVVTPAASVGEEGALVGRFTECTEQLIAVDG